MVTAEDGTNIVPTHDWTDFFASRLKKFIGIKDYHHFRFVAGEPGVVYARKHSDTAEEKVELLKDSSWSPGPQEYPAVVHPEGLSAKRQWYLFDKIRQFCPVNARDVTCPEPSVPRPTSRAGTPAHLSDDDDDGSLAPPLPRKVGIVGSVRGKDITAGHVLRSSEH